MNRVCLDSNILGWANGVASEGQEHMIPLAQALVARLMNDPETEIIVPTIVVSEFLSGIRHEKRHGIMKTMNLHFRIRPYDFDSSLVAVWLHDESKLKNTRKMLGGVTAVKFKADMFILATAIAHGASTLYTHDDGLIKMATTLTHIKAFDLHSASCEPQGKNP